MKCVSDGKFFPEIDVWTGSPTCEKLTIGGGGHHGLLETPIPGFEEELPILSIRDQNSVFRDVGEPIEDGEEEKGFERVEVAWGMKGLDLPHVIPWSKRNLPDGYGSRLDGGESK